MFTHRCLILLVEIPKGSEFYGRMGPIPNVFHMTSHISQIRLQEIIFPMFSKVFLKEISSYDPQLLEQLLPHGPLKDRVESAFCLETAARVVWPGDSTGGMSQKKNGGTMD